MGATPKLPSLQAAYADLFERLLDPIFLVDPVDQTILEMNPAAERILGENPTTSDKTWISCCIAEVVIPAKKAEFIKAIRVSARRFHSRRFESTWAVRGESPLDPQTLIIEVHACPLKLAGNKTVLQIIARDITVRRKMEQKIRELLYKLKESNDRLKLLSESDQVTGLKNYRHFLAQLAMYHPQAAQQQQEYSLVFISVDHLKHYSDRNGLQASDALLSHICTLLQEEPRPKDLLIKKSDESFALLCPGVGSEYAAHVAERLRTAVAGASFPNSEHQPNGSVTLSIGVASFPEHAGAPDHLIEVTERACQSSVRRGRNRVTVGALSVKNSTT